MAVLSYVLGGEELGRVRCDGIVVATPAGSTGYNLANGGPVLAWGVQGFVATFIAPHSLTARPLVVAPEDTLSLFNRSVAETVDVAVDGRRVGELAPGDSLDCSFVPGAALLAQLPGSSFYHDPAMGRNLTRFAFCKKLETLERAVERLGRLGGEGEKVRR